MKEIIVINEKGEELAKFTVNTDNNKDELNNDENLNQESENVKNKLEIIVQKYFPSTNEITNIKGLLEMDTKIQCNIQEDLKQVICKLKEYKEKPEKKSRISEANSILSSIDNLNTRKIDESRPIYLAFKSFNLKVQPQTSNSYWKKILGMFINNCQNIAHSKPPSFLIISNFYLYIIVKFI